jgi:hypothetical protein
MTECEAELQPASHAATARADVEANAMRLLMAELPLDQGSLYRRTALAVHEHLFARRYSPLARISRLHRRSM